MSNETTPATSTTPPSMVKKIGNITYPVWAHFSETITETMGNKIKRMLLNEVRQAMKRQHQE